MKKKKNKTIGKFTRHQNDRHRALLASAPESIEKRQNNIHNRNQMLASTLAYNLGLEKRMQSHLTSRPNALQRAATEEYMGTLTSRVNMLARAGLPYEKIDNINKYRCGLKDPLARRCCKSSRRTMLSSCQIGWLWISMIALQ